MCKVLDHLVKAMRSRKWCYEQARRTKHVELVKLDRVSCDSNMFVYYLCAYQNQGFFLNIGHLPLDITFVIGAW